jgi:hypothetical protein
VGQQPGDDLRVHRSTASRHAIHCLDELAWPRPPLACVPRHSASASCFPTTARWPRPRGRSPPRFPGTPAPAQIVIKAARIQAPRLRQAITSFETSALRGGALRQPVQLKVHRAANVAEIVAPLAGNGSDAASQRALTALRRDVIPQTLGRVPGTQALVGGDLASSVDYNNQLRHAIIAVGAFVMIAAFALMLLSLGSVVIAATAMTLLGERNWYLPR